MTHTIGLLHPGEMGATVGAAARLNEVRANARKAWRFSGEMEEIADTFAAAGLPDGFHRAAAEVYRRMSGYRDAASPPSVEEVATEVLAGTASGENPTAS